MDKLGWLAADWPAPGWIAAGTTTRLGGVSVAPYHSLNLASHVGDDSASVRLNRQRLHDFLQLPAKPGWLQQVHGCHIAQGQELTETPKADAAMTQRAGVVCAVMTADCLPVLITDRRGSQVAAVHAGWRGLLQGIIPETVRAMALAASDTLVWLGPAIGPQAFEVGAEVRTQFVDQNARFAEGFMAGAAADKWLMDIYAIARLQLQALGIRAVFGGGLCTVSDADRFFSYRRDGITGRMASLIWIRDRAA